MRLHTWSISGVPKPLTTSHRPCARAVLAHSRQEQHVALALMISLVMIMGCVFRQGVVQRLFPKENQPCQALFLDGAHPALGVGIQVGRSGWQDHTLDTSHIDDVLKGSTELGVAVMDEILTG